MSIKKNNNVGKIRKHNPQIAKERGARLKEEIRRRGLTQGEVAESLDMSLSGLTYLLSGRSQINRTMAYALEFKFNIGSEWILQGSGLRNPQIYLRLDPWERMILELYNRHFDQEYLDRVLKAHEWNERANDVLEYAEYAYLEGTMSPEENAEFTANIRKHLNKLQQERRSFFKHLNLDIKLEAEKIFDSESWESSSLREFLRNKEKIENYDSKEHRSSSLNIIRPLTMFLHFGDAEWNRIKLKYIAYQRVIVEDRFYHLALESLQEIQSEIKELITASDDQLKFIEEIRPKHIRRGEAKFMSENELDQLLKTHNKGENDGIDG